MKLTAATLLVLGGLSAPALADDDDDRRCASVPRGEWLSVAEIANRASAGGYEVLGVESDDGCWEVKAYDRDRRRVEVHYHPATAEMIYQDFDD
ncbi:PepSY domain-containing protein [Agaricicola taiwanensis]|nr:PepSY domain-containing protein [Agaricicola taiwanensis]